VVNDNGCLFSSSSELETATDSELLIEEIAFNPATCEQVIARAQLTPPQQAALNKLMGDSAYDGAGLANATQATYKRYLQTAWVDPINIDIARQTLNIQWVHNSSSLTVRQQLTYGWALCVKGLCADKTKLISNSKGGTGLVMTGKAHLQNTAFSFWVKLILGAPGWAACNFPTSNTANFYFDAKITANKTSQSSTYSKSDTKNGACTNLVHGATRTGNGNISQ